MLRRRRSRCSSYPGTVSTTAIYVPEDITVCFWKKKPVYDGA
jgi:hypothetical protein